MATGSQPPRNHRQSAVRAPLGEQSSGPGSGKAQGASKVRKVALEPASEPLELGAEEILGGDAVQPADSTAHLEAEADEVPGTPSRPGGKRTTPAGRSPRGSGGHARRPTTPRGPSGSPPARGSGGSATGGTLATRQPGAEIGRLHRRGMSLAVKFSFSISFLIILISFLFGLVVIRLFKEKLKDETVRSAYQQVLTLRAFGVRVYSSFLEWRENAKSKGDSYQQSPQGEKDYEDLQRIIRGDPRIKDLAILSNKEAQEEPSGIVLVGKDLQAFTRFDASKQEIVDLGEHGSEKLEIKLWWGDYNKVEKVLFCRVPIQGSGTKLNATANLILSAQQIDLEARGMIREISIFGLLFVAAGVALSLGLASLVTSPINYLVRDMDIVSRGDLNHEARPHTRDEIGLLAMAFNRMTRSLKEANVKEREVERLNSELNLAKEIHAKLMPEKLPNIPGIDPFTGYYCAKEVGGDYYDFIPVDKDHLAFVIADVAGKGIPGSMVMGMTRTILRMMASMNLSPADVLSKTNYHVARDIKRGMFVTAMYAILNVVTREMLVASAGHNPMVVWRAASKTCEMVRPNGIALGFDKGPIFNRTIREQKLKLNRGDRVVLYTDGVVEAMNEKHEEWGNDALLEFCSKHSDLKSKDFVRLMLKALDDHKGSAEQHDDITLTTFRIE